jgi:hypothetical protein
MVVIDFQYNKFTEINHLNKNFIPGVNKLKLTIDVVSSSNVYENAYPIVASQFKTMFPNLKKHLCCYEKMSQGFEDRTEEKIIDTIHFIEHVIIDIQCSVSKMKICSGITCNYYQPRNRYDIFVECIDERVGFFAAQFTTDIVQRLLNNDRFISNINCSQQLQLPQENHVDFASIDYDFPTYVTASLFDNHDVYKN